MGTDEAAGIKQDRMKKKTGGDEKKCKGRNRSMAGTFLVFFCALFLAAVSTKAQTKLDDLQNTLTVGSIEEKRNALFEIRSLHTPEASRIAIPALMDKVDIVRATAVSSVVFLPQDEALKLLLPLLKDDSEFVRRETAYAIGELGSPDAADGLAEDLKKENSIENRSAAAAALGKTGSVNAIEPLLDILRSKPSGSDGFLRGAAARSIGEIAQTIRFGKHQPTTPQNFLPDRYKTAFGGNDAAKLPAVFDSIVPILAKVLENSRESNDARREAAFALGAIGTTASLDRIRSCAGGQEYYLAEICREGLLAPPPPK